MELLPNTKNSYSITETMLKLHHTGCLVRDIEVSKKYYREELLFKEISETTLIESQKVLVCFVSLGNDTFLELIQPLETNATLQRLLDKKTTFYHMGFFAKEFEKTVEYLKLNNTIFLPEFKAEVFNDKRCVFFFTPEKHLIEIIDDG